MGRVGEMHVWNCSFIILFYEQSNVYSLLLVLPLICFFIIIFILYIYTFLVEKVDMDILNEEHLMANCTYVSSYYVKYVVFWFSQWFYNP